MIHRTLMGHGPEDDASPLPVQGLAHSGRLGAHKGDTSCRSPL